MAQNSIAASSSSATITFDDAPPKPETLRLTLKEKSYWARFKETTAEFSPHKILEAFELDKRKVMEKVNAGQPLTQADRDILNRGTRKKLKKMLKKFEDHCLAETDIKEGDSPEQVKLKISFSDQLLDWLGKLFDWIVTKMREIFATIWEGIENCAKKVKDFFEYLWSLF